MNLLQRLIQMWNHLVGLLIFAIFTPSSSVSSVKCRYTTVTHSLRKRSARALTNEHITIFLLGALSLTRLVVGLGANVSTQSLHAPIDESNGNVEFLQPHYVIAADALLETGTDIISAVLPRDEHLSQTNTSCAPKCCYQSVYCSYSVFPCQDMHC
jgi:hypothetical protein